MNVTFKKKDGSLHVMHVRYANILEKVGDGEIVRNEQTAPSDRSPFNRVAPVKQKKHKQYR